MKSIQTEVRRLSVFALSFAIMHLSLWGLGDKNGIIIDKIYPQADSSYSMRYVLTSKALGDNLSVVVNLVKNDTSFSIKSRSLPGRKKLLIYTDSVAVSNKNASGLLICLNMKYKFIANTDSLVIRLYSYSGKSVLGEMLPVQTPEISNNYPALAEEIISESEKSIFNTEYINNDAWQDFKRNFLSYTRQIQDDLEFLSLFYFMKPSSFSHYDLSKLKSSSLEKKINPGNIKEAQLQQLNDSSMLLQVFTFSGNGNMIDSLMLNIINSGSKYLVIDLRGNNGGGIGAAIKLLKYLVEKNTNAGCFVTRLWFDNHAYAPSDAEQRKFSSFNEGNTSDFIKMLKTTEGITIEIRPTGKTYAGKLFVLVDKKTASTCEPIVYGLKYYNRAKIIGENTAGAMLSQAPFILKNDWVLFLPVADYFTPDGIRLDKVGVSPDIVTESAKALDKVKDIIN